MSPIETNTLNNLDSQVQSILFIDQWLAITLTYRRPTGFQNRRSQSRLNDVHLMVMRSIPRRQSGDLAIWIVIITDTSRP